MNALQRLGTWETAMFAAGGIILAGLLTELVLIWFADAGLAWGIVQGVAAEVVTGREGGIPIALQAGVPRLLVFQISACQDIAFAFLAYPFFVYALLHFRDADNFLMRRVHRIEAAAHRHRAYVDKWGPLGVFLFMLVPFLINGPLVGLIIGRIGGMPSRNLILPVVASTAIAAAAWTFFYNRIFALTDAVHPSIGWIIALGVLVVLVLLALMDAWRDARGRDEEE